MIVLATLIESFAKLLDTLITVYSFIILISALLSFVRPDPYSPIVQILYRLTNPVYAFVRRYVPTIINGIDLAPLVVILILYVIRLFIVNPLFALATNVL